MKKATYCSLRSLAAPIGALVSVAIFPENLKGDGFVAIILISSYLTAWLILMSKPSIHRIIYTSITTILSVYATTLVGTIITNTNGAQLFENLFKMIVVTSVSLPFALMLCIPGFIVFLTIDIISAKYYQKQRVFHEIK